MEYLLEKCKIQRKMKRWTKLLDDYKKWKKKEKMEYLVDKNVQSVYY